MSVFVPKMNTLTGQTEWSVGTRAEYDYHQEIARSSYGDMLHDTERNILYEKAIAIAIKKMHSKGKAAFVLDIGTGTGLLSMMAVRHGADRVVACEAFVPMAECAEKVISLNGMSEKIKVLRKRSTSLKSRDIGGRANILVAEVFDTELIGEGALDTFHHACVHLLSNERIVIPSSANIIVHPVSCPFFKSWNNFGDICFDEKGEIIRPFPQNPEELNACTLQTKPIVPELAVLTPEKVAQCPGAPAVFDIQLDSLRQDQFTSISDSKKIFSFDFSEANFPLKVNNTKEMTFRANQDGPVNCIFMWWELSMDEDGKYKLSTAPHWAHLKSLNKQWRDHWMQAVYYPQREIYITKDQKFKVIGSHDEYSLWFNVETASADEDEILGIDDGTILKMLDVYDYEKNPMPVCNCGGHTSCSRTRVGMLGDPERNQIYYKALKKVINKDSVCLCRSDNSLLAVMAGKLGAKKVFTVQPYTDSYHFMLLYIEKNDLEGKVKVMKTDLEGLRYEDFEGLTINTIIGEPYFNCSAVPWENFCFLYTKSILAKVLDSPPLKDQTAAPPIFADKLTILPHSATIRAVAVEFKDLHKVRGVPVGTCEGFDLRPFDLLVCTSSQLSDAHIESHALWEYPGKALSPEFELIYVNFAAPIVGSVRQQERDGCVEFNGKGICNGIAMWVTYNFNEDAKDTVVIGGPKAPIVPNETIQWDPYTKQGVHFFPRPEGVDGSKYRVKYKTVFNVRDGEFKFTFHIRLSSVVNLEDPNEELDVVNDF